MEENKNVKGIDEIRVLLHIALLAICHMITFCLWSILEADSIYPQ
jgi:hypothetical protein